MNLSPEDAKRIHTFYESAIKKYGDADARSVHWADKHNQYTRFAILTGIANLSQKTILDVGCGFGDLYTFLQQRNISCEYTGIDIIPEFIQKAQTQFPSLPFKIENILDVTKQYDYVLASGALSFKVENNILYYQEIIKKMLSVAQYGVAFNMLDKHHHPDDETFAAYYSEDVVNFCKTFCENVHVVVDYLPQDFTIYLYK